MSLISMLLGIGLSSFIFVAAVQTYCHTQTLFHRQNKAIHHMDIGRVAFQYLERDLQAAGYRGCRSRDEAYPIHKMISHLHPMDRWIRFDRAVQGYKIGSRQHCRGKLPEASCNRLKLQSDVLLAFSVPEKPHTLKTPIIDPLNHRYVETKETCTIPNKALVLLSDCHQAEVFFVTDRHQNRVGHNESLAMNQSAHLSKPYGVDAELQELKTIAYYLGVPERYKQNRDPTDETFSLFRDDLANKAVEILANVQTFQIEYGRLDPDTDTLQYKTARELRDREWAAVQVLRIHIGIRDETPCIYEIALRNGIGSVVHDHPAGHGVLH